jgi:hypothetical protein
VSEISRREFAAVIGVAAAPLVAQQPDARHRVLVSTDIGGSDPDDFQSMVHFLVCAEMFDVEGLVSSPWGAGRKEHILEVIDKYEIDYPNLKTYSDRYPEPHTLRGMTKEGALDFFVGPGYEKPTEGSEWIIRCAKRKDPRPLYVLVWGTIEDVAQALHDDPSIKEQLRVYFIAGPNKKWGTAAYNYVEQNHPDLWMIENNSSYVGWFVGGDQRGRLDNTAFVNEYVAGHGALGSYFAKFRKGEMKMGDTPSVVYMFGTPEDPTKEGWGGRFVRAWQRPKVVWERMTTLDDEIEVFGLIELVVKGPAQEGTQASLIIAGQEFPGAYEGNGLYRLRFMPKSVGTWDYRVKSTAPSLNGLSGKFRSVPPPPDSASRPSSRYRRWWTDDPDPRLAEGPHSGAKTVSRWREQFLMDFARRMDRCQKPAARATQ